MRISNPRNFNSKLIDELQLSAVSGNITTAYESFIKNALKGSSDQTAPVSYGYAYLDATGKVDTKLIPPLAINETYTVEATNDDSEKSQLDLIKEALASVENVQRGDIAIIYGTPDIEYETAKKLCGTYIFTADIATSAITSGDYKAIYTPAGNVISVNEQTAVNGNVTVDASHIPYLSGTVESTLNDYSTRLDTAEGEIDTLQANVSTLSSDITTIKAGPETPGSMQYYAKEAADTAKTEAIASGKAYTDEQIDTLSSTITAIDKFVKVDTLESAGKAEDTLYYTEAGQFGVYNAGKLVTLSLDVVNNIISSSGDDDKIATVAAIKNYIAANTVKKVTGTENNLVAFGADGTIKDSTYKITTDTTLSGANDIPTATAVKTYVDEQVVEAAGDLAEVKARAIEITEVTHQWADGEKSGQTYTWTTEGRVIQICDENGWVFPDVAFEGSGDAISSVISVTLDAVTSTITGENWTYYIASKITKQ